MHPQSQKAGLSPSLIARTSSKGLSLALALCLLCPPLPILAAETDEAALARAETILFGEQVQGGDFEERLERVEKRIFHKRKGGSDEERVERITSTLLIDRKKLKITKNAAEAEKKAETQAEPAVEKQAESLPEKPVESLPATQSEPVAQTPSEPVTQPQPEPVEQTQAKAEKPAEQKGKGKLAVKQTAKHSKKVAGKSKGRSVAAKKQDIILTSETASLDSRKEEKRPSALDTPVSYTSSSSNRISRGSAPKVHQAAKLLKEGMEAHRRGEDAKAEQLFKRVVLLEPRNPDGYYNLGALAENKKDLAGALMSYRAALNLSPNDRELKEAVDSVESMLGVETSEQKVAGGDRARSANGNYDRTAEVEQDELRRSEPRGSETKSAEERSAEIREYYARESAVREHAAMESSDRFASAQGTYGFGHSRHSGRSAHNGPAPAPNFYRAKAKTTREIQEEAAPYANVNDPDSPVLSVSPPPAAVVNAGQPQPFQLQTQRSQATVQAAQQKRPSAAGTATRAILGMALSVGTSYALRSAGLHCPVCRIGGGGGALRGLLRF